MFAVIQEAFVPVSHHQIPTASISMISISNHAS